MTALASRFTISGDVRCFAGEALTVEIAFDTAGSLVDLTGREWAWTVYRANDREPLFSAAGEVVSVGDDHFVRFVIDGDTTDELFARNRIGLRHEMAEVTTGGRDVWVEGQFSIARSAAAVSPAPVSATAGSVTRFVFDYQTRRVTISPRGGPGFSAAQQLAQAGVIDAPTIDAMAEWQRAPAIDAAADVAALTLDLGQAFSEQQAQVDDAIDAQSAAIAAGFASEAEARDAAIADEAEARAKQVGDLGILTGAALAERIKSADLADPAKGAKFVRLPSGGRVDQAIGWISPEMCGAVGDGVTDDTDAVQAAVNTGLPVQLAPGATYLVSREIMPPMGELLFINGWHKTGDKCSTIKAAPGFKGWVLRPRSGYRLTNFKIVGNDEDGCYLIGSPDDSSAGLAVIDTVYIANADIAIYFGGAWEHPWGLQYDQINGIGFRTGAISLGGTTEAASSGESAWTMDNINVICRAEGGGIAAPPQVVTVNTPDATHDLISWDSSTTPLYGWCVMRSADGATGWHVPPNWTSPGLMANSFSAQKAAGETWTYSVVRMTRGVHIRRGKAIMMGMVQSEYFGVGLYYGDGLALTLGTFYKEMRDRGPAPLAAFCGIYASNADLTICSGWVEQTGYGFVSANNAHVNMVGTLELSNLKWGKAAQGGATQQSIRHPGDMIARGSTPDTIVAFGGDAQAFIRSGIEQNRTTGSMTSYVDGTAGSKYSVRFRGIEKAAVFINGAGEGEIKADRASFALISKALRPTFTNSAIRTDLVAGIATPFITIALADNTSVGLVVQCQIQSSDAGSVQRQAVMVELYVEVVRAATEVVVAAINSVVARASQGGTGVAPTFDVTVSGNTATLRCTHTTNQLTSRIYPQVVSAVGSGAATATITAL